MSVCVSVYLCWDPLPPQTYGHAHSWLQLRGRSRHRPSDTLRRLEDERSLDRRRLVVQVDGDGGQSGERDVGAAQRVVPTAQVHLRRREGAETQSNTPGDTPGDGSDESSALTCRLGCWDRKVRRTCWLLRMRTEARSGSKSGLSRWWNGSLVMSLPSKE